MNGKWLVGGLGVIVAAFGGGLWYASNFAYYQPVTDVTEITAFGKTLAVSDYQGIDADTSPLKMRACFMAQWDAADYQDHHVAAQPLIAPKWFDCFDAAKLTLDIDAGLVDVLRASKNEPYGFSRFIARYPDGRAFMWRQINPCGTAKFAGDDLPAGCGEEQSNLGETRNIAPITTPKEAVSEVVVASVRPTTLPIVVVPTVNLQEISSIIRLVPLIGVEPEEITTGTLSALGHDDFPLRFHGCFNMPQSFGLLTETFETAEPATPETVTGGLSCFDAEQLAEDLQIGYAIAFWGERNIQPGIDRVVAVYDDGRAFVWHQNNINYAE